MCSCLTREANEPVRMHEAGATKENEPMRMHEAGATKVEAYSVSQSC